MNMETNFDKNLMLRWARHTFQSNRNSYPGTAMFKLQLEHEYESNVNSYPKQSINLQVNVLNQDSSVSLFFLISCFVLFVFFVCFDLFVFLVCLQIVHSLVKCYVTKYTSLT